MPRITKVEYRCDGPDYHRSYSGKSEDGEGWVSAVEMADHSIEVNRVNTLREIDFEQEGRLYFENTSCLAEWMKAKLFPVSELLVSEPPVPGGNTEGKQKTDDDIPF